MHLSGTTHGITLSYIINFRLNELLIGVSYYLNNCRARLNQFMLFFFKVLFHNASLIFMSSDVLKEGNFFSQWVICGSVDRERILVLVKQFLKFHCCCFSVAQLCLTLCDPMGCNETGLPVPHHLPEFSQVHVHCIIDAVQPSHPLMPSSHSALNLSQHQGLFQCHLFTSDDQNTGASASASVS